MTLALGKYQSTYHARYIALYCRVSTDEQAREGVSLDEQQERLKAYCRAMGWNEEVLLFIDDGYSAKSTERPQLTKLLSEIKEGNVSKIMVTKLDRVSRRLLDLLMLIDLFMEYNVAFAQAVMEKPSVAPRAKTSPHLLGGLLKCGNCGSGMSIGWSGSPRNRYRVYRCSANKNKGTCTSKQYKADEVETWFKEGLRQLCHSLPTLVMPFYLEKVVSHETNQVEQKLRTAKNRYKRKVEA